MYIIAGDNKDNIANIDKKYILLELDTFKVNDEHVPSYCVLDSSSVNLSDIKSLTNYKELHTNLIKNYKLANWKFCTDAIEHLYGKFNGELDSFYDAFKERIVALEKTHLPENWTGVIDQSK